MNTQSILDLLESDAKTMLLQEAERRNSSVPDVIAAILAKIAAKHKRTQAAKQCVEVKP